MSSSTVPEYDYNPVTRTISVREHQVPKPRETLQKTLLVILFFGAPTLASLMVSLVVKWPI